MRVWAMSRRKTLDQLAAVQYCETNYYHKLNTGRNRTPWMMIGNWCIIFPEVSGKHWGSFGRCTCMCPRLDISALAHLPLICHYRLLYLSSDFVRFEAMLLGTTRVSNIPRSTTEDISPMEICLHMWALALSTSIRWIEQGRSQWSWETTFKVTSAIWYR